MFWRVSLLDFGCMTYTYCCVYSARLLVVDRQTVRNMYSSIAKNKLEKWMLLVGFIIRTYHGPLNVILELQH